MLTVKQVAERWGVSPSTIYALVGSGKLRCTRIGLGRGCLRFTEAQLADHLAAAERGIVAPPVNLPKPVRRVVLKRLNLD